MEIKQIHQRSSELLSAYWMYGVRTNIFGETDCNLNGGASVFYGRPEMVTINQFQKFHARD